MGFKIRDLVAVLKKSGIVKYHMIHSLKESEQAHVKIHIPTNSDVRALEKNLYTDTPVGLQFEIIYSGKSYFKEQMIKRWGKTAKITTCYSFEAWDIECAEMEMRE